MLEHFYHIPQQTTDWRALRSEGYLGDARIARPDGSWIRLEELPALLRTLLVTDGTVTKVLEAFFWEPVQVNALKLEERFAPGAIPWLGLSRGEQILSRHVELRGARSGNAYAEAFSVVKLAEFDPALRNALVLGSVGIGVLLRESGLETYREILEVGVESDSTGDAQHARVYRTYRITRGKQPVILIRESFPWRLYGEIAV